MTEASEPRKKYRATVTQTVAIHNKLGEVLTEVSEGCFVYAEGWTDQAVAEFVDPVGKLSATHVKHVRSEAFGSLARAKDIQDTNIVSRIAALEARVTEMEKRLEPVNPVDTPAAEGTLLFGEGPKDKIPSAV